MAKRGGASEINGFISMPRASLTAMKTGGAMKSTAARGRGVGSRDDSEAEVAKVGRTRPMVAPGSSYKPVQMAAATAKSSQAPAQKLAGSTGTIDKKNRAATRKTDSRPPISTKEIQARAHTSTKEVEVKTRTFIKEVVATKRVTPEELYARTRVAMKNEVKSRAHVPTKGMRDSKIRTSLLEQPSRPDKAGTRKVKKPATDVVKAKGDGAVANRSDSEKQTWQSSNGSNSSPADGGSAVAETVQSPLLRLGTAATERVLSSTIGIMALSEPSEHEVRPAAVDQVSRSPTASSRATSNSDGSDDSYQYEDDFEDYESDFEEDLGSESGMSGGGDEGDRERTYSLSGSSGEDGEELAGGGETVAMMQQPRYGEEERKMDSGIYELGRKGGEQQLRREIRAAKEALQRENCELDHRLSDHEQQQTRVDTCFETAVMAPQRGIINFVKARQQQTEQKVAEQVRRRGDRLLDMIRLDRVGFVLLDIAPVPYELYIKCYGRSNTTQMSTQTNEDRLDEETQTEEVQTSGKWTQCPAVFSHVKPSVRDRLGVGGEDIEEDADLWKKKLQVNTPRLHSFLCTAGEAMLTWLEVNSSFSGCGEDDGNVVIERDTGLSRELRHLGVGSVSFLHGRPVSLVRFSVCRADQLLTVHAPSDKRARDGFKVAENVQEETVGRCMLCIWSLLEPSRPRTVLVASEVATAVCFDALRSTLVFAGLSDGSVCIWDLREKSSWHQQTAVDSEWITLRSPTYSTAEVLKASGHLSPVVSLEPLQRPDQHDTAPIQVVSLEEEGVLMVWTVLAASLHAAADDLGLAQWGRVRLVPSARFAVNACFPTELHAGLECIALAVLNAHLLVGTNSGSVAHCLATGDKGTPVLYVADTYDIDRVVCIEVLATLDSFFLVGCSSGNVRLYTLRSETPLALLSPPEQCTPLKCLALSASRMGLFFTLHADSSLHVWDISTGDIRPAVSLDYKDHCLTAMQHSLSTSHSVLVLGTASGQVEVHQLKDDLGTREADSGLRQGRIFVELVRAL